MSQVFRVAIALALGVFLGAGAGDVHAVCGVPGSIFTCNYFDAPIAQDPTLTSGAFWGLGHFNPASPGGSDNGNVPSSEWVRYFSPGGFYLAGDWAGDLYDGCIQDPPNPQPAKMAAMWSTSDGADSYFVALCTDEDASGTFLGFLDLPGADMTRVPKSAIHMSSHSGSVVNLTVGHEPLVGGVYNKPGCGLGVTGFRVYHRIVPRNAFPPTGPGSRNPSSGWTLLGERVGPGDVTGGVTCVINEDIYLMITLVFDFNVELRQGSRNSAKIECGPNFANPTGEGDDFRFIRKPKSAKGR